MKFLPTTISGVVVIELEPIADERGHFARTWCRDTFAQQGLDSDLAQCNVSFNRKAGTLRGMHYQADPHAEAKLVRVTRGRLFDVAVDLRPDSPTYCQWVGEELSADNGRMLYLAKGIAHGFQTLTDDTEIYYQMSHAYHAESARGVRWNDPAFAINWPDAASRIMSERDANWPDFPRK